MVNEATIAWIALGSNATSPSGTPLDTVIAAVQQIQSDSCEIILKSRMFSTPAFPEGSGADFVNAAVGVRTILAPHTLLKHLHVVEKSLGRVRTERWGSRTIDLDLLAFGNDVLPDAKTQAAWRNLPLNEQMARAPDQLILPHPRLQERAFVLMPLNDIAPEWRHPILGETVSEMLAARPEVEKTTIVPMTKGI